MVKPFNGMSQRAHFRYNNEGEYRREGPTPQWAWKRKSSGDRGDKSSCNSGEENYKTGLTPATCGKEGKKRKTGTWSTLGLQAYWGQVPRSNAEGS